MKKKLTNSSTTTNGHCFDDDDVDKEIKYKESNVLRRREVIKDECKIDVGLLHNNELRNLQIPFVQSLQCEELSNLQGHINEKVHYHYHKTSSSKNMNVGKHKKLKKEVEN